MQDPNLNETATSSLGVTRDVIDIILGGSIATMSAIGGWVGKRLMRTIDGKVDKEVFEQHVEDVTARLDEAAWRHEQDRGEIKTELREVNNKLDKLVGYLIQRSNPPHDQD